MNLIQFHFMVPCSLGNRSLLKRFTVSFLKKEKRSLESLNIVFCSDEYLLGLNRQFLGHDFYTDILSFPLSTPPAPLSAEIYISVDRVRDNAANAGSSFKEELHRVIFHGILHFCGYKDKTRMQIVKMREMEDYCLKAYKRRINHKD